MKLVNRDQDKANKQVKCPVCSQPTPLSNNQQDKVTCKFCQEVFSLSQISEEVIKL